MLHNDAWCYAQMQIWKHTANCTEIPNMYSTLQHNESFIPIGIRQDFLSYANDAWRSWWNWNAQINDAWLEWQTATCLCVANCLEILNLQCNRSCQAIFLVMHVEYMFHVEIILEIRNRTFDLPDGFYARMIHQKMRNSEYIQIS